MKPSSKSLQTAVFTVQAEQAGKRLDVFLASQLPELSRSQVQALIQKGQVVPQFELKTLKAGLVTQVGQAYQVTILPSVESGLKPQPIDLDVVFEDKELLVINKPVGLVVHPGAGNPDQTLINALIAHCPGLEGVGGVQRPGLVHRLDKDTSGLLVVGKTDLAYKSLVKQLKTRKLSREYLGIVKGELKEDGTVDAPIGRHAGSRQKMAVRVESGKPAVTHFRFLEAKPEASLLHLKLQTGRTHQIRVHMAYIKHPILGDAVYGDHSNLAPRQMLHAFRLSFQHPKTGTVKAFMVDPPEDFKGCLSNLGFKKRKWKEVQWD